MSEHCDVTSPFIVMIYKLVDIECLCNMQFFSLSVKPKLPLVRQLELSVKLLRMIARSIAEITVIHLFVSRD